MLEFVHDLMKFVQVRDVFMCDYILVIKIYQFDLCKMYNDPTFHFGLKTFLNSQILLQTEIVR